MAEFVPVEHDPFATDAGTTLAHAADDVSGTPDRGPPTFSTSDSLSRFYDVWKKGSDKYAGMVDNPLDISRLGDTWQQTPGMDLFGGFGPGDVGMIGSTRMPPLSRVNDLVNKFRLQNYLGNFDNPDNQNVSQEEIKNMVGEPLDRFERNWRNYGKHMTPDEVMASGTVWDTAALYAEAGKGEAQGFADAANDIWRRMGANRYITKEIARRYIVVERAKSRGIRFVPVDHDPFTGEE